MRRFAVILAVSAFVPCASIVGQQQPPGGRWEEHTGLELMLHGVWSETVGDQGGNGPGVELGLGRHFRSGAVVELRGGYRSWQRTEWSTEHTVGLLLGLRYELPLHTRFVMAPVAGIGLAAETYRDDLPIAVTVDLGTRLCLRITPRLGFVLGTAYRMSKSGLHGTSHLDFVGGLNVRP